MYKGEVTGSSTSQRKKLKKSKVEGLALAIEDGKNKKDLQGHSKGCKLVTGLTAAAAFDGAKKIHDKTSSERVENDSISYIGSANSRAQNENVLLAAVGKLCGFAIPQRENKKKMKVRVEKKGVTPPDHASESLELQNEQGIGLSMSQRKKEKKVKLGEHILGEKVLNTCDHALGSHPEFANEQVSSLSVSQRKKKKKARVGNGTPGKKISGPKDFALGSHAELPNESTVNGDTHGKELKIKKRKKENMESQIISAIVENDELQTISKEQVSDILVVNGEEPRKHTKLQGSRNRKGSKRNI